MSTYGAGTYGVGTYGVLGGEQEPSTPFTHYGPGLQWARLEMEGQEPLDLVREHELGPIDLMELDFGFPEPREVTRRSPMTDGESDTTELHGSRVISAVARVFDGDGQPANYWAMKLRRFLHPSLRPWLVYKFREEEDARRIMLRSENAPLIYTAGLVSYLELPLMWKAPTGRIESYEEQVVTIGPQATEPGRTYPLVYPRIYPNAGPISGAFVNNNGDARANTILRLYGPVVNPAVYNDTLSERMGHTMAYVFDGLTLFQGDYIEINAEKRTVRLNGLPTESRIKYLDYEASAWWSLAIGVNRIRYVASSYDTNSRLDIRWRNTYL